MQIVQPTDFKENGKLTTPMFVEQNGVFRELIFSQMTGQNHGVLTVGQEVANPMDTGWLDITSGTTPPPTATLANPNGKVFLRRIGKQVTLQFNGYGWTNNASTQTFLNADICAWVRPALVRVNNQNVMLRHGGVLMADNRAALSLYYDWIGVDRFRLSSSNAFITFGAITWTTDTPFPKEIPYPKLQML